MDPISQVVLGGSVAYVVAGKQAPRKALLWGAAIAVLPDLDVLIPYDNGLDTVTFHRSWTHSWLVQSLVAPIMASVLHRFDKTFSFSTWWLLIWLALVTHAGLDALTVYGTQLFWPFMPPPVSIGSIFIIDPIYTVPMLAGFIVILLWPRRRFSDKIIRYGFVFSCAYLLWGAGVQQWISQQAEDALAKQHIEYKNLQVSATAFNTLLWRVVAVDNNHYYETFRSVFDDHEMTFRRYDRGSELINVTQQLPALKRIQWFTDGLFKLEKYNDRIIATDLRMGMEPSYFFQYSLAVEKQGGIEPTTPNRFRGKSNRKQTLDWVWQRIWKPDTSVDF